MRLIVFGLVFSTSLLTLGCIPFHKRSPSETNQAGAEQDLLNPLGEIDSGRPAPTLSRSSNSRNQASIAALDSKTYRISLKEEEVWDALLSVLMRNYNLVVVDKQAGVITTEWDSYYVNQTVYRNKLSVRMRKPSRQFLELSLHNNVEKLQDGAAAGTVGAVWLPADDQDKEAGRVVQNLAIVLNQPVPTMHPGYVADGNAGREKEAPTNR